MSRAAKVVIGRELLQGFSYPAFPQLRTVEAMVKGPEKVGIQVLYRRTLAASAFERFRNRLQDSLPNFGRESQSASPLLFPPFSPCTCLERGPQTPRGVEWFSE